MKQLADDVFIFKGLASHRDFDESLPFSVPKFRGKFPMNLEMCCYGKHWNAVDNKYYDLAVGPVPSEFISEAAKLSIKVFPYHNPNWDIAIINRYKRGSSLGPHRDNSESKEALDIGHPVVSFSFGASAEFVFGQDRNSLTKITLDDCDVLIFGGKSRLMYHGITKVLGKRINVTLRKY